MKSSGVIIPRSGWGQRTRASKPIRARSDSRRWGCQCRVSAPAEMASRNSRSSRRRSRSAASWPGAKQWMLGRGAARAAVSASSARASSSPASSPSSGAMAMPISAVMAGPAPSMGKGGARAATMRSASCSAPPGSCNAVCTTAKRSAPRRATISSCRTASRSRAATSRRARSPPARPWASLTSRKCRRSSTSTPLFQPWRRARARAPSRRSRKPAWAGRPVSASRVCGASGLACATRRARPAASGRTSAAATAAIARAASGTPATGRCAVSQKAAPASTRAASPATEGRVFAVSEDRTGPAMVGKMARDL